MTCATGSATTVVVKNLPATSSFLAFGPGNRLYSASFAGKVTRCVYTFQSFSKALGSTPYPPVVNQCLTTTASVAGVAVQPVLGPVLVRAPQRSAQCAVAARRRDAGAGRAGGEQREQTRRKEPAGARWASLRVKG